MNIKFDHVSLNYGNEDIITNLSFDLNSKSKGVIKGASASGKTTLLNMVMGFSVPDRGKIMVDGIVVDGGNVFEIRSRIGWLPQEFPFGTGSVREVMMYPFQFKRNKSLKPSDNDILELMDAFDLSRNVLDKSFEEVSGGQKQRLGLITILLLKREVLLLDEPTSALDNHSKKLIIDYLFGNQDLTILSASHDPDWVNSFETVLEL